MTDVPDGEVDPDTGHCCAAIEGDCAPASCVTFLWAAGVVTTEKHLHYALGMGGPDGTTAAGVEAALGVMLAGKPWTTEVEYTFDPTESQPRALLLGYVKSTGNGHMVAVLPGPGGAWLHDPSDDARQLLSWDQVAALKPNLVISLVPKAA